jgi:cell division protease FtsH
MSPAIGPISVLPPPGQEAPFGQDGASSATEQLIIEEVRRIIDDCYAQAVTTLPEHREQLDRLAHTLLQGETLTRTRLTQPPDSIGNPPQRRSLAGRRPAPSRPGPAAGERAG